MSSEHEPHLTHADEDHHETLDLDPVQTLPPDEAPSPSWLPFVGAGLVLLASTAWALGGSGQPGDAAGSVGAKAATASPRAALSAPPAESPPRRAPVRRPRPDAVAGPTAGATDGVAPPNIRDARRRIEERRAKQAGSKAP